MDNELYLKSSVDCLYTPRKEGGRGLQGAEETVNLTNLGLDNYVKESKESQFTAARSVDIDLTQPVRKTTVKTKKQNKEERTIFGEEKMLHDQFVRQTKEVENEDKCQWL